MKKPFLLLIVCGLCLTVTACSRPTNREYYEEAQLYLGAGDFEAAAMLFSQLGEYEDSAEYALYCAGLYALENGDHALARTDMLAVLPFKSSARYLSYLDALQAEEAGEPETALALYEALGSFEDSRMQAERLREEIPEAAMQEGRRLMVAKEYEQALEIFLGLEGYGQSDLYADNCRKAIDRAAYDAAAALCQAGDHLGAMKAFLALGDKLDAADRAADCRAELVSALDAAAVTAGVTDAAALIEGYTAIGDDAALACAEELTARFGVNLRVLQSADAQPFVLLGSYPMGESGVESALLWRVIKAEGETLTLLCGSVIDASPVATVTDLKLTEAEQAAVTAHALPSMSDLAALSDLTCAATPYAVAQGVPQEGGQALYWLRDSLESGLHPVVTGDGGLQVPGEEMTPGVRPMVTLSLREHVFTAGTGTAEDPFR